VRAARSRASIGASNFASKKTSSGTNPVVGARHDDVGTLDRKKRASRARVSDTHLDLVVPEVLAGVGQLEQDGVRHGLAGQRRPRGSERDGRLVLRRHGEDFPNLFFVVHLDDHLREQPVEGGVRSVGERLDGIRVHALLRDELGDVRAEVGVPPVVDPPAVHVVVLLHGRAQHDRVHRATLNVHGVDDVARLRGGRVASGRGDDRAHDRGARRRGRERPEHLHHASLAPHLVGGLPAAAPGEAREVK